jgi:hypothetical protein
MVMVRRIRWEGYEACLREIKNSYKILVRTPEGITWETSIYRMCQKYLTVFEMK